MARLNERNLPKVRGGDRPDEVGFNDIRRVNPKLARLHAICECQEFVETCNRISGFRLTLPWQSLYPALTFHANFQIQASHGRLHAIDDALRGPCSRKCRRLTVTSSQRGCSFKSCPTISGSSKTSIPLTDSFCEGQARGIGPSPTHARGVQA